ncbi:unnamed protein product, partial [Sphacelaria rigidula]
GGDVGGSSVQHGDSGGYGGGDQEIGGGSGGSGGNGGGSRGRLAKLPDPDPIPPPPCASGSKFSVDTFNRIVRADFSGRVPPQDQEYALRLFEISDITVIIKGLGAQL